MSQISGVEACPSVVFLHRKWDQADLLSALWEPGMGSQGSRAPKEKLHDSTNLFPLECLGVSESLCGCRKMSIIDQSYGKTRAPPNEKFGNSHMLPGASRAVLCRRSSQ